MTTRLRVLASLAFTSLALLLCLLPAQAQTRLTLTSYSYASDRRICSPASTVRVYALLTEGNPPNTLSSTWTFQSATFTVDGTPHTAPSSGSNICYFDWDTTGVANPSEHTISVTATVHCNYPASTQTVTSTDPAPPAQGPYPPNTVYGDGRVADFVVADIRLKSIGFTGSVALNQDATTPVPSPEFTWDPSTFSLTSSNPAAYIQGRSVGLTMQVCKPDGSALGSGVPIGYTLKLQATPNTTNPATGQPDPALTLFDNTTANPVAPTVFTSPATVTANTALNGWVANYGMSFSALNFYVKFTQVTPAVWGMVNSYASTSNPVSNTVYTVLAQPTAPMATPWVPVLNYACSWAARTSDATSATTALTNSEWNNCTYDEGTVYTDLTNNSIPQDGQEVFSLQHFLNNTLHRGSPLTGDCRTFADFLCCLSNAIGATPLQVQRSASAYDITHNGDSHCFFSTKYGFQAPPVSGVYAQTVAWVYHQWTTSNVYDGAFKVSIRNNPTTYPTRVIALTNKSLTDYHNTLVDTTTLPCFWQPQTAFTPSVVN